MQRPFLLAGELALPAAEFRVTRVTLLKFRQFFSNSPLKIPEILIEYQSDLEEFKNNLKDKNILPKRGFNSCIFATVKTISSEE